MAINRTEKLNISIRPDLKEGVKMLFCGEKLSESFEILIYQYIDNKLNALNKSITDIKETIGIINPYGEENEIVKELRARLKETEKGYNDLIDIRAESFGR